MSNAPGTRPQVVAIGAYERDNFGDLLYLELMRHHVGEAVELAFVAPIGADMSEAFGHAVPAAAPLLAQGGYEAIWTVGGEVGSATAEYAYRTAFGDEAFAQLMGMTHRERAAVLRRATEGPLPDSPYVTRTSSHGYPRAALVLNSVGLAGVAQAKGVRRIVLESSLREADFISVRDGGSRRVLSALRINHVLAPDLAHTLPYVRPLATVDPCYALVQLPEFAVTRHGLDAWVGAIASLTQLSDLPLRLFLAGTAPGHDSVRTANRLRDAIASATNQSVEVSTARGVWPRVDEIAHSALWVGGSLHGRIVAAAYGVPRVSIHSWKVDQYAETWDDEYPYGVAPETLSAAVEFALAKRNHADPEALASGALKSIQRATELVVGWNYPALDSTRLDALLRTRVAEVTALQELATSYEDEIGRIARVDLREETVRLGDELRRLRDEIDRFREERDRWRTSHEELREALATAQAETERLRGDRDGWRAEAERLREDRDRWRAEGEGLREDRERRRTSPDQMSDGDISA